MDCPHCGTPEQARVRVCRSCGTAYASEDLFQLRGLEYLIKETASWPGAEARRVPYVQALAALKSCLTLNATSAAIITSAAAVPAGSSLPSEPAARVAEPVPPSAPRVATPAAPPPPAVPFDQWLLSERNIKLALS